MVDGTLISGRSWTEAGPSLARHAFLRVVASVVLTFAAACPALAAPFVDAAGRTVDLPDRVERIVAAGPPAATLLYTLAPDKLAGWVREPSAAEREFIAAPYRDLPTTGRITGRGNTANIQAVVAAKPDLILDVGSVDPTYASLADRVQAQTGIPYVLLDGTLAKTSETYRTLGKLVGAEARADELASDAEDILARAAATAARHRDAPAKVYYGRGPEGLETGLGGSINVEALEMVGAANVAAAGGAGGLTTVSPEQVLAWKPDTVIVADARALESLRTNPVWASLPAVRDGRVLKAPSLPFGWFDSPPSVNRLIGLEWLTAVLYPQDEGADLRLTTREFYARFYRVSLTDERIDELLRDALPTLR